MIRTLATGAAVAGGSALAACAQQSGAAQIPPKELPPPETTTVRIVMPPECDPGIWFAKDYLLSEGFKVSFVTTPFTSQRWLTNDLADFAPAHAEFTVATIAAGLPLTILAGLHTGCFELWVDRSIANVRDLRGRRISVRQGSTSDQFFVFFAVLLGSIGIDLLKDVHLVESGPDDYPGMIAAYTEGRADAVLAGGAQGPSLKRLKAPGHVILETMTEKPWSQYVCCHLVANRDWARRNPIATQYVTRAVLRATDAAAKDHARAAHDSVAGGFPKEESLVTAAMDMSTYNWRDLEPEETLRFFGLWLAKVKLIKSTPEQLIQNGTDLAYMRRLRSELKS